MNLKKILTGIVAGAMAVSAMGVAAFAEVKDVDLSDLTGYTLTNNVFKVCEDWDGEVAIDEDVNVSFQLDETYSGDDMVAIQLAYVDGSWSWHHDYVDAVYSADETYKVTVPAGTYHMFQIAPSSEKDGAGDDLGSTCWQYDFKNVTATTGEEDETPEETEETEDPTTEGLETALYVGNNVDWAIVNSESVFVAIDNEYTYSISDLDIAPDNLTVIYIKDVAVENEEATSSDIDPVKVTVTSLKINGTEVAVKEGVPTGLNKDGVFDIAFYNIWGDSFIDLPEENINSVEISVKVEKADAEVPAESTPADTTDPDATEDPDATDETTTADDAVAGTGEGTGTPTGTGDNNQPTGIAIAVVPAVIAAAGVIVAKKRK